MGFFLLSEFREPNQNAKYVGEKSFSESKQFLKGFMEPCHHEIS